MLFGGLLVLLVILLPKGILPTLAALMEKARTQRHRGTFRCPAQSAGSPARADGGPSGRRRPDAPLLEVRGLHKSFGGNHAVNDCSFTVPEGSITALIGPNGSGKTTVFNLISGTMTPDEGEILLNGERIESLSPWSRAHRGIGRTFQITRLFREMTVLENVVAPLRDFSVRQLGLGAVSGSEAARAEELLEFVGMSAYRDARAGALSYGQQKLVELAQVLMLDPKLILLDEPAGGINPTLIERMGDLIRDLNAQGTTFLLVEHNMPFVVGLCDPIRVLARGAVIAQRHTRADPEGSAGARRLPRRRLPARSALESPAVGKRPCGGEESGMIRLEGVVAGYGGGNVLQGVDLEVGAGELGCIVGPNGAGKSTVLRAVSGLLKPSAGRILLDGEDITGLSPDADAALRRHPGAAEQRAVSDADRPREHPDGRLRHSQAARPGAPAL